jgi:hypothetical protein
MGVSVVNAIQVRNSVSTLTTTLEVTAAAVPMRAALSDYSSQVTACHGELTCITSLDRTMASALTTYEDVLRTISVPSQAAAAKGEADHHGVEYGGHLRRAGLGHLGWPVRQHPAVIRGRTGNGRVRHGL